MAEPREGRVTDRTLVAAIIVALGGNGFSFISSRGGQSDIARELRKTRETIERIEVDVARSNATFTQQLGELGRRMDGYERDRRKARGG